MSTHPSAATPKPIAISFLLDRSGSMSSIKEATILGINTFVETQKKSGVPTTFSLTTFDLPSDAQQADLEHVFQSVPIDTIVPLDDFTPRGGTPLYDAFGDTIKWFEERVKGQDVRVLFIVMTDGEENSSKKWKLHNLKALVETKTGEGWEFVYMGANQDAYMNAQAMGVSAGNTMSYDATASGVRGMTLSTAKRATAYASAGDSYESGTFFSGGSQGNASPANPTPQPDASGLKWGDPVKHSIPPAPPIPQPKTEDSGLKWGTK